MTLSTDPVTLAVLYEACDSDNDEGRTHLQEFMWFGTDMCTVAIDGDVHELEPAPGTPAPHSDCSIIRTLIERIWELEGT